VDDNQSGQLDRKVVCAKYYCVDQTCCQNRVGWVREILDRNKIVKKNLGYYSLNKKQSFELKTEEIGSNQVLDFFKNVILRFGSKKIKFKGEIGI
jgi:hypothetical protein